MRSTHQSRLASVMFVLGVLPSACAHETQAEMVALSELETAGTGGVATTGGGGSGVSGSALFGGGRAGSATNGGTEPVSFSGTFGVPSAGSGGSDASSGGKAGAAGASTAGNAGTAGTAGSGGSAPAGPRECQTTKLSVSQAQASSEEDASLGAGMACDGVATSRWSSAHSQPQWIRFELDEPSRVSRVSIRWEAAYASDYRVEVSDAANGPWEQLFRDQEGNGGTDDVMDFPATTARFVRVSGLERATAYGFSIFEVEIYGDTNEACEE
jgi:hypothetical protein